MSKLDAREIRLIAHYGLPSRLDTVITATLAYQGAHTALRRAQAALDGAADTLAVAEELAAALPADLELHALAARQHAEARARLAKTAEALRVKTEHFFEAAGAAAVALIALLEAGGYDLDREALLSALEEPLATH